jgi:hypothetical protein
MSRVQRLVFAALLLGFCAAPSTAAVVSYDLSVIAGGFEGTGSISLNDASGAGVADPDFVAFSFTVTSQISAGAPLPFTFTKSMVSSIDWLITGGALALDLDVNTQTVGADQYDLSLDTLPLVGVVSVTCVLPVPLSGTAEFCSSSGPAGTFTAAVLLATPAAAAVSEPMTVALLGLALAGLAFARRRKQ